MTPKEFDFLFGLLEETSRAMYQRGYDDAKAGKPIADQSFTVGKNNRLLIKTNLKKLTERR